MKKLIVSIVLISVSFLCSSQIASASFINPNPAAFANDDGTELFANSGTTFSIKVYDLLNDSGLDSTFGFFFQGTPGTLIPIFTAGTSNTAFIDFGTGQILDVDQGILRDNAFSGSGNIGFYLNSVALNLTLYSVSSLNPFGLDTVGTFPSLASPSTYLIEFAVPNGDILSLELFSPITPVNPVPEPSTIVLTVSGMVLLLFCRRRVNRNIS